MNKLRFEDLLERDGTLTYTNVGTSMLPLLREGRDLFTVEKKGEERCRVGDVVLFRRRDEAYVLHRIVEVRPDGYVLLGDNCVSCEKGVRDEDILGVMSAFVRGGKEYSGMYLSLLHQYAATHHRITEDGRRLDWIDESRSPLKDEWYSRERLKEGGWTHSGGYERGKDYNHSTFCDLVLSFLCEIRSEGGRPDLVLHVPDGWDYLDIENLYIGGCEREVHYRKP